MVSGVEGKVSGRTREESASRRRGCVLGHGLPRRAPSSIAFGCTSIGGALTRAIPGECGKAPASEWQVQKQMLRAAFRVFWFRTRRGVRGEMGEEAAFLLRMEESKNMV